MSHRCLITTKLLLGKLLFQDLPPFPSMEVQVDLAPVEEAILSETYSGKKSCSTKRMVETLYIWGMLTTYQLMQDFATIHHRETVKDRVLEACLVIVILHLRKLRSRNVLS